MLVAFDVHIFLALDLVIRGIQFFFKKSTPQMPLLSVAYCLFKVFAKNVLLPLF